MDLLKLKKKIWEVVGGAALCLYSLSGSAGENSLQLFEQKIKAGLVYNLLKYTTWPTQSGFVYQGELQICLFSSDPFDGYLSPLQGRTAQRAPIFIKQISQIHLIKNCNVVIVHRNQESQLSELVHFLADKQVLTISDINKFTQRGGMIEMAVEGDKIKLYINKNIVDGAGLQVEKRLLDLAKITSG